MWLDNNYNKPELYKMMRMLSSHRLKISLYLICLSACLIFSQQTFAQKACYNFFSPTRSITEQPGQYDNAFKDLKKALPMYRKNATDNFDTKEKVHKLLVELTSQVQVLRAFKSNIPRELTNNIAITKYLTNLLQTRLKELETDYLKLKNEEMLLESYSNTLLMWKRTLSSLQIALKSNHIVNANSTLENIIGKKHYEDFMQSSNLNHKDKLTHLFIPLVESLPNKKQTLIDVFFVEKGDVLDRNTSALLLFKIQFYKDLNHYFRTNQINMEIAPYFTGNGRINKNILKKLKANFTPYYNELNAIFVKQTTRQVKFDRHTRESKHLVRHAKNSQDRSANDTRHNKKYRKDHKHGDPDLKNYR